MWAAARQAWYAWPRSVWVEDDRDAILAQAVCWRANVQGDTDRDDEGKGLRASTQRALVAE